MRRTSSTVQGSQRAKFPDAMLTWFKIYEFTVVIESGFMLKSGNSALQSSSSTSTWYTQIAYAPRSRARARRRARPIFSIMTMSNTWFNVAVRSYIVEAQYFPTI